MILLIPVWLFFSAYAYIVMNNKKEPVKEEDVELKTGIVESARCLPSRTADLLILDVMFEGDTSTTYVSRQLVSVSCNQEIVDAAINKILKLGVYKNLHIGFYLNGEEFESIEEGLESANDWKIAIFFSCLFR